MGRKGGLYSGREPLFGVWVNEGHYLGFLQSLCHGWGNKWQKLREQPGVSPNPDWSSIPHLPTHALLKHFHPFSNASPCIGSCWRICCLHERTMRENFGLEHSGKVSFCFGIISMLALLIKHHWIEPNFWNPSFFYSLVYIVPPISANEFSYDLHVVPTKICGLDPRFIAQTNGEFEAVHCLGKYSLDHRLDEHFSTRLR